MSALREDTRITDPDTGERYYPYPPTREPLDSVTTVIGGTDSKPWIAKWHARSSTEFCVDNLPLIGKALREKGRKAAVALGADAAENLRNIKRDAGTSVHDVLEALILWATSPGRSGAGVAIPLLPDHLEGALYDGEPLADVVDAMVNGFMQFVVDFGPRFRATEMAVYNQPLGYAGTLDMIVELTGYAICSDPSCKWAGAHLVACPGNVLVILIDTKTGREQEGTWKEQMAAYRRCPECLLPFGEIAAMPAADCTAVLHLRQEYPDGYSLMLVGADADEAAWDRFLRALSVYRERQEIKAKPGKAVRALREDGTMPGPRLCDLAAEGYGRALAPLRAALGADLELEDLARFSGTDVLAIKGVGGKLIITIRQMLADHGLTLAAEAKAA